MSTPTTPTVADVIGSLTDALASLIPDVEAHRFYSDETLKRTIETVEDALAKLRTLETTGDGDDDPDVEAHKFFSDENLKQSIRKVEDALAKLQALQQAQQK